MLLTNFQEQYKQLNQANYKASNFVSQYYQYAKQSEAENGINALAIMAQAALESGWGITVVGNMLFGIKATPNTPAHKRQLLTTTEYLRSSNVEFPEVISVTKQSNGLYKYKVKDWFRKYDTPKESFDDHAKFFFENPRYAKALTVRSDANRFVEEIAKAGYATAPNYAGTLKSIIKTIERYV